MDLFKIVTPISYLVLVLLWGSILLLYLRIRSRAVAGSAMGVLLGVLALDSLRTLFESSYFGLYFGSLYGFLPESVYDALSPPLMVSIPKIINMGVGLAVLTLLLQRWMPSMLDEQQAQQQQIKRLEKEIGERQRAEAKLREAQQYFQHKATHDDLTGLPNRFRLLEQIQHEIYKADRSNQPLGVLFIDLDRFKQVNDTLGHSAGDEVLIEVARRLKSNIRAADTIARLSGDEFIALVTELPGSQTAANIGEKLRQAMEQPFEIQDESVYLSCTVGIALYPQDAQCPEKLIQLADTAMYGAKNSGRNIVQFYEPEMTEELNRRVQLTNQLRDVVHNQQLSLVFQPMMDLRQNRAIGAEALLRWQHPTQGKLLPGSFLELAEESGMIVPIGQWVVHESFKTLAKWRDQGLDLRDFVLSINLSSRQLSHQGLGSHIIETLDHFSLPASSVQLEITESVLMGYPEKAIQTLQRLRDRGVEIAVDNFGTGYSSLSFLKKLPLTRLKIDRSFIDGLPNDIDDVALTKTMIALGQNLKLGLIGEGVEYSEQAHFLNRNGCHIAQGYALGEPVSAEQFQQLLQPFSRSTG